MNSLDNDKISVIKKSPLIKKLFHNYFHILVILVLLSVFTVGFFAFINPKLIQARTNISTKKAEKEKKIKDLEEYLSKLRKYKLDYEKISEQDRKSINTILPQGFNYEDMYREVQATAKKIGIELISSTISAGGAKQNVPARKRQVVKQPQTKKEGVPDNVGVITVDLEIGGLNYSGLINVLSAYEKDLRIIDIKNIDWQPKGESVKLKFDTYFLKD